MVNYVNWPQVFGYNFVAKLEDEKIFTDNTLRKRWSEFIELIDYDTEVIVDGYKYSLTSLGNKDHIKNMMRNMAKRYKKLITELDIKIKRYFTLLRLIFDRVDMKGSAGISIFEILQKIYERFFIPELVSHQNFTDFFLYYLRFLC